MCHLLLKTTNHIRLTLKSKHKDVFGDNIPELYFKAKGSSNCGRISNITHTQMVEAWWLVHLPLQSVGPALWVNWFEPWPETVCCVIGKDTLLL